MKFDIWMKLNRKHNFLVKKFLRYYDSHPDMVYCRSDVSIIKYLLKHQVNQYLINEFKIVWMYYEQSRMMEIKVQRWSKKRID